MAGKSAGFADATGTSAKFNTPKGVAVAPDGAFALVADMDNHRIRHIVLATKAVTTLAGSSSGSTDATGTSAKFNYPHGVAVSPDGVFALVADFVRHGHERQAD